MHVVSNKSFDWNVNSASHTEVMNPTQLKKNVSSSPRSFPFLITAIPSSFQTNVGGGITYQGKNLADGEWHLILVTVDNEALVLSFYVDGVKIGENPMVQALADGPGVQYVGGLNPGTEMYVGLLQDVRLFGRTLQQG